MKLGVVFTILLTLVPAAQLSAAGSTPAAKAVISKAVGAILQADGPRARQLLSGLAPTELGAKDDTFRACALSRLQTIPAAPSSTTDPLVREVLSAYRTYWQQSLASSADRPLAEHALLARLSKSLAVPAPETIGALEPTLAQALQRRGFHSLEGKTGVLFELMVWRKQDLRHEHVTLPDGSVSTPVFYLDDFLSRGWSSYFTCDRTGTGGWTKEEGLYLVVPSYTSLADENFRVNFLAHESQHLYDRRHFAGLPDWRLEYRAKLVELALAKKTMRKILSAFSSDQGDNPADAHSYANRRVLAALGKRIPIPSPAALMDLSTAVINRAAVKELLVDTAQLRASPTRMARP